MDPLVSVITNVPEWLKRLEELNGQIEQRQQDLAKFSGGRPPSVAQSIRPRGSMESLKPPDDGAAFLAPDPFPDPIPNPIPDRTTNQPPAPIITAVPPQTPDGHRRSYGAQPPSTPASDPWTGSSLVRHTNELVATARRRARATVRKRQKTDSMISAEGTTPKYRTRRMVMVYYDSYVQSFFEELVKFVSAQRNLMRKAKMAAKVAHIKRLAEIEMPEEDEDQETASAEEMRLQCLNPRSYGGALRSPAYNLMPGRGMRSSALNGGLGIFNEKGDIWDELDKGLEYVQVLCERAAHQFLRDGDCNEEIEKIKRRLVKVQELAVNEKERVTAETAETTKSEIRPEPEHAMPHEAAQHNEIEISAHKQQAVPELTHEIPEPQHEIGNIEQNLVPEVTRDVVPETELIKPRTFRPSTIRMETGASNPGKFSIRDGPLEIDEGIDIDMYDFKPVYRSTRLMRRRAQQANDGTLY
ncbi:hypothetical protein F4777DRAFT_588794 [Nemania sp. FL0916]|nr:hypothetical protein F4777DRAFT_588794 [Nemania sp. FL0916]